jgi:ubiquinone/menaquinone biosynthesis C-methylase UbiE
MAKKIPAQINKCEVSKKAMFTALRYTGNVAHKYEKRRENQDKWKGENQKIREYLNRDLKGTSILDIPCGTGRFFKFYQERGFKFIGMDISNDMIEKANKRTIYNDQVQIGNIFDIDTCTVFDVVVCIRFLNLVDPEDVTKALKEMQRVGRRIIFTLRTKQKNPTAHYHHAYPISLIKKSLLPNWKISRNDPVHERDYRMIEVVDEMG